MRKVFRAVADRLPFETDAWVILPDHMHAVWTLPEGDSDYSTRWAMVKKEMAKHLRSLVEANQVTSGSRMRHRDGTIWQRRFWEHQIRDEPDYRAHLDYIHFNSVKHGLAGAPKDWQYSSFRNWVALGAYDENWGSDGAITLLHNTGHE